MSVWTDTATVLAGRFTVARTDTITSARTTTAGALNTTTGVIAAPTTSAPLAAVGAYIAYGNATTFDFGQELAHRDIFSVFLADDADVARNDRLTIDACALDADLVGDVLIVLAVDQQTANARKVAICELAT